MHKELQGGYSDELYKSKNDISATPAYKFFKEYAEKKLVYDTFSKEWVYKSVTN